MTTWQPGMVITAARLADDHPGPWQTPALVTWVQGTLSYAPLRVQRDGSRARLDGHAQPGASFTGSQVAFTIPDGLRPMQPHYYAVPRVTSGTPTLVGVGVGADGAVTVFTSTSIGPTDRFDFTGIAWPLT